MKNRFSGKYYKFVSKDKFIFAIIDSLSNEGLIKQIITKDGSFQIADYNSIIIENDTVSINIEQENLIMKGILKMSDFHPLKHKAMGPFSIFSMECSHEIYSMYHRIDGKIHYNGNEHVFHEGFGYIEGDAGVNFPEKYIWYNSVGEDYGVTLAIATIPFGFIKFTGLLGFISYDNKEYDLCTYTGAKIVLNNPNKIQIKKKDYKLTITLNEHGGHLLKAPVAGNMDRLIKENVAVETEFCLSKNDKIILQRHDENSSLEYMY